MGETVYNLISPNIINWGKSVKGNSSQKIKLVEHWAFPIITHPNILNLIKPGTKYSISYKIRIDRLPSQGTLFEQRSGLALYSRVSNSKSISLEFYSKKWDVGQEVYVSRTFTSPDVIPDDYQLLSYTVIYDDNGKRHFGDTTISDLMLVEGPTPAAWAPSAEEEISVGGWLDE